MANHIFCFSDVITKKQFDKALTKKFRLKRWFFFKKKYLIILTGKEGWDLASEQSKSGYKSPFLEFIRQNYDRLLEIEIHENLDISVKPKTSISHSLNAVLCNSIEELNFFKLFYEDYISSVV